MYADRITQSMREAIDETRRRRALQLAYNEEHHIVPQTIKKSLTDVAAFITDAHNTLDSKSRKDGVFYTEKGAVQDRYYHTSNPKGTMRGQAGAGSGDAGNEAAQQSLTQQSPDGAPSPLASGAELSLAALSQDELAAMIGSLNDEMFEASAAMDFERAARVRDQIVELESLKDGASVDEILARLKRAAHTTSAFGKKQRFRARKR